MAACPICGEEFRERGLKRHITVMHGGATQNVVPDEPLDVELGGETGEQPYYAPPEMPTPKPRRKRVSASPKQDVSQIADMLILVFDGLGRAAFGPAGALEPLEHEYIDPAIHRLVARYLPENLSDRASGYADVIMLGFGLFLYGMRMQQVVRAQRVARQTIPVAERLEQTGVFEHDMPYPPQPTPEQEAWRAVQTPGNGVTGQTPPGTDPFTSSMFGGEL